MPAEGIVIGVLGKLPIAPERGVKKVYPMWLVEEGAGPNDQAIRVHDKNDIDPPEK